jgi:hypothetical protein
MWVRELSEAEERALNAKCGVPLPLPPRDRWRKGISFEVMTEIQAEYWLESYNAWVALWNAHETSRYLPLGPRWQQAEHVLWMDGRSDGVITFIPRGQKKGAEQMGWIRPEGRYTHYGPGMSCCRTMAKGPVKWAGWANGVHESFFQDEREMA